MMRKWMNKKLIVLFALVLALVMNGMQWTGTVTVAKADSSYSAEFKYNGRTYTIASIEGTKAISLSDILSPLEITGSVTAADVSEDQGMTVTTYTLTMTKPFGSGWLKVTADGTEYQITINSTPNSITVVLYGTLRFDKNGGSGIMDGQSIREYSQTVLPDCTFTPPDGHTFDQWEISGARYDAGATYFFGQTTTAKAIWKLREGVHSITADYNNSDGDVVVSPTMAAADEPVTVTVQPVAGKAVDSISYYYGSTAGQALSGGEGGVYTFSMPGEATTVSVTFKDTAKEPIAYVNENGSSQSCNDYRYIRSTDTSWTGWVVASQNMTLDSRVTVSGTVNLILMDGKTLTIAGGIGVGKGTTLNIYAQSGNSGKLIAGNRSNSYYAGIGAGVGTMTVAHYGNITINGGVIKAEGGTWSAGIGGSYKNDDGGVIVIRGNANVTAYGTENAAAIGGGYSGSGGKITIQGNPVVTATGRNNDSAGIGGGLSGSFSQINISGGTVKATGGNMANAIGSGRGQAGGTISITGGNVTATATGSWGAGIGSQCDSITIGGNAVVNATGASQGAGIGGCYQNPGGKITIADNANVTAVGGAYAAGIGTGYNAVADGETAISITGGTVNASVASSNGAAAIGSGNKARGKTTISISNGSVTASGSSIYGVGIGGGNSGESGEEIVVNITGGTVNASGRAGIGTANASNAKQTINISGGMVTARGAIDGSNKCAAIGQGNNSNSVTEINITGGIVRALGTGTGIGSGTNSKQTPVIKLGYTDETKNDMEITAIDYNGTVTLNNVFKYQDGTGAVTDPITANKTIVPSDSTAHTHSFTYSVDGKTITATCANSDNQCNLAENKATLTIGEPDGKTSMVYDGTAKAAALTGDTEVLTAEVEYKKGDTVLPAAPSDVGSYTASISLGEVTATVSYEITKKPVTFASITAKDKVYDGTTKASCSIGTGVNGAVSGDSVSANVSSGVANFDTPDVGVNKAVTFTNWTLQGSSKDNYEMIQPEPQYRTITPRIITITAKEQTVAKGGTVNSTPEQVEVTGGTLVEGQRIAEVTLTGDTSSITDSGTITASAVKIMDASNGDMTANYYVNYTAGKLIVTDAPDHTHSFTYSASGATITATCADTENCQLTNQQAALTIEALSSVTYDGTAKVATITGDTAVLGTPSITYSGSGSTTYTASNTAPTNAGTYTAGFTLGEGDEAKTASVSYTIVPKSVIITGLTASDKVYDGTTTATATGTPTIYEKVGSDDVSVATGSATFATANVGNQSVTFSAYSLDGTAAGNYSLSGQPAETRAAITARPITIQAENQSVELNGTITYGVEKVTVSSDTKLVDGHRIDAIVLTPSSTENATTSGSITPSAATIRDASAQDVTANYSITYAAGVLTVTKVQANVTEAPAANDRPYNGLAGDLLTGGAADTSLEYSTNGTDFSGTVPQGKNADTYTVYYRAAADSNHEAGGSVTLTATISPASLTVTAKQKTITYGDQPANDGVTYSDFVSGETESVLGGTLDYEYSYRQYDPVGEAYTIMPKGLTSTNYDISFASSTLTVKQKEVGLAWSTEQLTFNGTPQAPDATATGLVNQDSCDVTVSVDGEHVNAGDNYIATATGLSNNNYRLPATASTTFSISKAAAQTLTDVTQVQNWSVTSISDSVAGKMPANAGTLTYTAGSAAKTGNVTVSGFTVDGDGNVTATLSGGDVGDTITLPVTISSTNYADSTVNVIITLTEKADAEVTITPGDAQTKTYGDENFTLEAAAANAGMGTGTWTWTSSNPDVAGVTSGAATATVTIRAASSNPVTIKAAYESDDTVGQATILLTVNPKSVEIPTAASGLKWTGEELTGVAEGTEFTVTDGKKTAVGDYTATASLVSTTNYRWSDNTTAPKTISWSIAKAEGPAAPDELTGVAPTSQNGSDGKITEVTAAMEYATKADFSDSADCTGTEISGLPAGTYYVRLKETDTHEAGQSVTVNVPAYVAPIYSVTITAGEHMSKTTDSGAASQEITEGSTMMDVVYKADDGCYFPEGYTVDSVNGISVTRMDDTQIKVNGSPTADASITLNAATEKAKETMPAATFTASGVDSGTLTNVNSGMKYSVDGGTTWTEITDTTVILGSGVTTANGIHVMKPGNGTTTLDSDTKIITVTKAETPATPEATNCTTAANDDGRIIGVTAAMEYRKSNADTWMEGTGADLTGLVPGAYYVRVKAAGTTLASDNLELTITEYIAPAQVATPTFDPAGNTFTEAQDVTIACTTENATIYYTTDGSDPTSQSKLYSAVIPISETTTLKAIAMKEGMTSSAIAEATYIINIPDPELKTISAAATGFDGAYDGQAHGITVSVTDPESGAAIRYGTINGTYDLTSSPTITNVADSPLTVYYQITADGYNPLTGSASVTIRKADAAVHAPRAAGSLVYNGSAQALITEGSVEGGTMLYAMTKEKTAPAAGKFSRTVPTGTDAGTYSVWYRVKGDANHTDIEAAVITVEIGKAAATITAEEKTKVFGEQDPELTATVSGTVGEDQLAYTLSRREGENVGEYAITVTPGSNPNYDVTDVDGKLIITSKSIDGATVTLNRNQLVYSGTEQGVAIQKVGIGETVLTVDDYTAEGLTGTAVGSYTAKVTGRGNYQGSATATWTISKKTMKVSVETVNVPYDGEAHGITVTVTEPAEGAQVLYGLEAGKVELTESPTLTEIGSMTVYYRVVAEGYTEYSGMTTVTVEKAETVILTAPAAKKPVSIGKAQELITEGTAEGGTMMYALGTDAETEPTEGWGTAVPMAADAGTYYVWYRVVGDERHQDSTAACLTVTVAESKKESFVARCYRILLGRKGDEEGLKAWIELMDSGKLGAAEVVYGFVAGEEFTGFRMSSEAVAEALYQVMLNRAPSAEEKAQCADMLEKETKISPVMIGAMINSIARTEEFRKFCKSMEVRHGKVRTGLLPGDVNADGTVDGRDAVQLMKYLAGEEDPETGEAYEIDEKAADLNGDGEINEVDLLRLMKMMTED